MNDTFVNTQLISASVNGRTDNVELAEPVYYTLEHVEVCIRDICRQYPIKIQLFYYGVFI